MTYTKEQLEESMIKFYNKHGRAPVYKEMTGDEYVSGGVYTKRYGSFKSAIEQILDIQYTGHNKYTDEELINYIHQYVKEFGIVPSYDALNKPSDYPIASTYVTRFGSLSNAVTKAGYTPNPTYSTYTAEELIDYIHKYILEYNEIPTAHNISINKKYPSETAFVNKFGAWSNALAAAGITHDYTNWFYTNCDKCGQQMPKTKYAKRQNKWICQECNTNGLGKAQRHRYRHTTKTMTLAYKRERCAAILHSAFQMRKFETRFNSIWDHDMTQCTPLEMI